MSWIIVTRNPKTKHLIGIVNGDQDQVLAEFETEDEAMEAAGNTTVCKAWGFEILEIAGY